MNPQFNAVDPEEVQKAISVITKALGESKTPPVPGYIAMFLLIEQAKTDGKLNIELIKIPMNEEVN